MAVDVQDGSDAAAVDKPHQVSPAPPSQAVPDTPDVLQMSNLTVSVATVSGSEDVAENVIVEPGLIGLGLADMAVKVGL